MPTKTEITQRLLDLLPEQDKITFDQASMVWWANIRDNGGLRLTRYGFDTLTKTLKLENWSVEIDPKQVTKKLLLDLDRKLTFPYFIERKARSIIFFSSREAMMASLYGNIKAWIDSCESRSSAGNNYL